MIIAPFPFTARTTAAAFKQILRGRKLEFKKRCQDSCLRSLIDLKTMTVVSVSKSNGHCYCKWIEEKFILPDFHQLKISIITDRLTTINRLKLFERKLYQTALLSAVGGTVSFLITKLTDLT